MGGVPVGPARPTGAFGPRGVTHGVGSFGGVTRVHPGGPTAADPRSGWLARVARVLLRRHP